MMDRDLAQCVTKSRNQPDNEALVVNEKSPSIAQYFTWINNTNEGSSEKQTLVNLEFFSWLQTEYGMQLDIYAWDAGNFDGAAAAYGDFNSESYRQKYPRGFQPVYEKARALGCRLGIWSGPDGFGDTEESEQARINDIVSLCRRYDFQLFKLDGVCGGLRPEKVPVFIQMMRTCRQFCPDLIVLNHRLELGAGMKYATTFLFEGAESYIDVHMSNASTASHHRAGALERGLPSGLQRMAEDHGVCLSSCLDFWDDDLILQAFNRCLILAPQIYGNPWLLRDEEFPRLARIYNIHRKYRDILVDGILLDETRYGPNAVSRGNERTRFVTLRNLDWAPKEYTVKLDGSLGLMECEDVELRLLHPRERVLGSFQHGSEVSVEVSPFRACLLMVAVDGTGEVGISGCDYEFISNPMDKPVRINLLGIPGSTATLKVIGGGELSRAEVGGESAPELFGESGLEVTFPGVMSRAAYHRRLGHLSRCEVPADAEALFESTCFAADSNALEVRSLARSGSTSIPAVEAARKAFFEQTTFVGRGVWDKYLFDGRLDTFFSVWREEDDLRVRGGAWRVDFGERVHVDKIVLRTVQELDGDGQVQRDLARSGYDAEVSSDLVYWEKISFELTQAEEETVAVAKISNNGGTVAWVRGRIDRLEAKVAVCKGIRYLRMATGPDRIAEIEGYLQAKMLDRSNWRASNLLPSYSSAPALKAWSGDFALETADAGSLICVALEGRHGIEGASVAIRSRNGFIGAGDRAVSFPSVAWEYVVKPCEADSTWYIPVTNQLTEDRFDVVVLGLAQDVDVRPNVWITRHDPFVKLALELSEQAQSGL